MMRYLLRSPTVKDNEQKEKYTNVTAELMLSNYQHLSVTKIQKGEREIIPLDLLTLIR